MANAEIIAVGSEMLTPKRVDTNSLFLTERLNALGVEVIRKSVVGDVLDRLAAEITGSMSRVEFVIISGGLGPTEDDLTRDAVALAVGRKLVFHPEISDALEQRFRAGGRQMPERNRRQAFLVEGGEFLPNDRGTAPGQWVEHRGRVVVMLPGPPHELEAMFTRQCLDRIARRVPPQVIRTLIFRVAGMSESELDQAIAPVYRKYENPVTTILAHAGDIQVHLRARCATEVEAEAILSEVGSKIELLLGDRIYSRAGEPLEEVVGELLKRQHLTLAVAESATGGGLAERVTSVPGSSEYFLGGLITYTRQAKIALLGIDNALIDQFGAVSAETAEAMAAGARLRTGATHALSITGNAGPGRDGEQAPVGMVYVGLADATGTLAIHRQFFGDRTRVRHFAGQMALDLLRRRLERLA